MKFLTFILSFAAATAVFTMAAAAQTFTNPAPITIDDDSTASPYPSNITVSGVAGTIPAIPGSVRVTLNNFSHTFPEDVGIVLVSPTGAALLLQNGVTDGTEGNPASNITYTISDAGATLLPEDSPLVNDATYKPTSYFSGDSFPPPGPGTAYNNPGPEGDGRATFSSTFGGTNPNGVWKLFVADFVAGDSGVISGGWTLAFTSGVAAPPARANADFNGDGKTDLSVFGPSNGFWYYLNSPDNQYGAAQFGLSGDKPVPADFDGDKRTDFAVCRNGVWYILKSRDNSVRITQFGLADDVPVPIDFDGDGKADIAVWRPSNGVWYYLRSSDGAFRAAQFGTRGDKPVAGDYDRDGKADLAVFRPSSGTWYILQSANNGFSAVQFGLAEDKPVPADYDGDGGTDIAVFRPSNGVWYVLRGSDNKFQSAQFGQNGDIPVPGDYDGDGKTDFAVFRPSNGVWYILRSLDNGFRALQFGAAGDVPIPAANLP
ncbi:MAG TPA: FG-GAP-like repeat-containing protein [Pyrinomonadaceae bacterium]|nr:FG-GAP-like repeat-containing protein [Pyrinomonadaceae bacterium]